MESSSSAKCVGWRFVWRGEGGRTPTLATPLPTPRWDGRPSPHDPAHCTADCFATSITTHRTVASGLRKGYLGLCSVGMALQQRLQQRQAAGSLCFAKSHEAPRIARSVPVVPSSTTSSAAPLATHAVRQFSRPGRRGTSVVVRASAHKPWKPLDCRLVLEVSPASSIPLPNCTRPCASWYPMLLCGSLPGTGRDEDN